jgi:hypothetical protein
MVKHSTSRASAAWRGLAVPLLLLALGIGCNDDKLTEVSPGDTDPELARKSVMALVVSPDSARIASGRTVQFIAKGIRRDSSTTSVTVTWVATGGTITSTGEYTAGATPGNYRVIAKNSTATLVDTSEVTVDSTAAPPDSAVADTGAEVSASTGTYYVAPTGSDANAGTATAPFRTVQKAANVVQPGNVVIVRDGIYTGPTGSGTALVNITRGGTSSAWVTFKAEHRWGAKLNAQNNATQYGIFLKTGANYVRIEGFEIYGTKNSAFLAYNGAHHVDFVRNHVHNAGRNCSDSNIGQNGAFVGGGVRYVTLERNLFHDIGRFAPGENGCSLSTTNYQNHDHGVYVEQADDVIIRNNIFYNIKRGFSIQRYSSSGYVASRLWILNNTFAFPNPYRSAHITIQTGATDMRVENNVFYDPKDAALSFASMSFPNLTVKNNITYSGVIKTGSPSGATFSGNLDNTDPRLMAPGSANFRLQDGSPAIDRGLSLSEVKADFDGLSRPRGAGYDLGAFEH